MRLLPKPQTLYKAISVIEAVAANQPVEIKRLCELLKIPPPTMYRFISALAEKGYIARVPGDGKCQLGMSLVRLAAIALKPFRLAENLHPVLQEIAAKTMESVSFQVRRGAEAICVDYVESEHSIRLSQRIGQVTPLYAGSGPKVLLAYTGESEREKLITDMRLKKIGAKTITSKMELRERLREIVRRGYDISEEEVTDGARGVAVPVFGSTGVVVAALSVSGLKYRMGKDALAKALKTLKISAEKLSDRLPLELLSPIA